MHQHPKIFMELDPLHQLHGAAIVGTIRYSLHLRLNITIELYPILKKIVSCVDFNGKIDIIY